MNNVTVLLKPIHAVRQCVDKGSFLNMTSFRQLFFTRVLFLISSLRPITGMSLSDEAILVCTEAKTNRVSLVSPDLNTIEQLLDELWRRIRDRGIFDSFKLLSIKNGCGFPKTLFGVPCFWFDLIKRQFLLQERVMPVFGRI